MISGVADVLVRMSGGDLSERSEVPGEVVEVELLRLLLIDQPVVVVLRGEEGADQSLADRIVRDLEISQSSSLFVCTTYHAPVLGGRVLSIYNIYHSTVHYLSL